MMDLDTIRERHAELLRQRERERRRRELDIALERHVQRTANHPAVAQCTDDELKRDILRQKARILGLDLDDLEAAEIALELVRWHRDRSAPLTGTYRCYLDLIADARANVARYINRRYVTEEGSTLVAKSWTIEGDQA